MVVNMHDPHMKPILLKFIKLDSAISILWF